MKLPQSENSQEKEILQQKTENDELKKLVHQMTDQIKTMESQTEALTKENEELGKAQPMVIPTVIPTVNTAIPSTLAEHLAPKGVLATAVPITSQEISTSSSSSSQRSTLQDKDKEILSLKGIIKNLENSKNDALITSKGNEQRVDRLQEQVKIL